MRRAKDRIRRGIRGSRCRIRLRASLERALVGAINQPLIHWINRPTFQQVVEVQRAAPR